MGNKLNLNLRRSAACLAVVVCSLLVLLVSFAVTGSAAPPPGDAEFGIIADAADSFLNSRPIIYMTSVELMAALDDNGDGVIDALDIPGNDPLVIDVRSATDYAALGHIPGAINIPYKDIVKTGSLATIRSELARHCNKQIVLVCYTGHTDKMADMALGSVANAGYFGTPAPDVTALEWGNLGWNTPSEPTHIPTYTNTFAMEMTPNSSSVTEPYPMVDNTTSTEPAEIDRVAGDIALGVSGHVVPGTGAGQINDTNVSSWTVIDVRSPAEYAASHIPTAINIPYQQLFAQDGGGDYLDLLSIDTSKPVMTYANAQWEGNAAAVGLNSLGVRNATKATMGLRWGLANWNYNYGIQFSGSYTYPDVAGSAPGGLYNDYACACAGSTPNLHLSLPTPFWGSYADYTAGLLSVSWTVSNPALTTTAYDIKITGSVNTNGVTLATPALPATVANIMSAGGSATTTFQYNVPAGVGSWHTTNAASATDICATSYTYPLP